jgi:hypothetical protein
MSHFKTICQVKYIKGQISKLACSKKYDFEIRLLAGFIGF